MMSHLARVPCPLCGEGEHFLQAANTNTDAHIGKYGDLYAGHVKSGWDVCGRCGFVFQNPRPSLDALNEFYLNADYHADIPDEWRDPAAYLKFAAWYYDEKIAYALRHSGLKTGRVYDVGFGHGGVLRLLSDRGWQIGGVEPDATYLDFAAQTLGLTGLAQGILDGATTVTDKADLAFSNHTFEHVADLDGLMRGVQNVLKPGGYVFTAIPTYYKNRSRQSLEWMNSAHYSMFTHQSLNQLFARYGLEEVAHTYRGWHKEVDDLWHLARYTGNAPDPERFYEKPEEVARYVNVLNPLHTRLFAPLYANYPAKVQRRERLLYVARLAVTQPGTALRKAARHLRPGGRP